MFHVKGYEDDEVQSTKSGQSVSDYEGDMKQLPPTMYFGDELCRAQFLMTATGDVVHECGKGLEQCRRPGHRVLRDSGSRGATGYYDTIQGKTTIDGNAATFMTAAGLAVKLASQGASNLASYATCSNPRPIACYPIFPPPSCLATRVLAYNSLSVRNFSSLQ
jgi:hypothetical protein